MKLNVITSYSIHYTKLYDFIWCVASYMSWVAALPGAQTDRSSNQCGNGHSRSFSLPICHRRASPCGSTIRKKMISPPKTMS